jgi:hypothetical protein
MMANKYNPINDVFICDCGSTEHLFVFRVWDFADEDWVVDEPCCSLDVFLSDVPFWTRLKRGLAYIFGRKCRYGHFDSADIGYDDASRLISGLTKYQSMILKFRNSRSNKRQQSLKDEEWRCLGV